MPQKDIHHDTVKRALLKDGWQVTRDHLSIKYGGLHVQIDLAAEKGGTVQKTAIEVKVFEGTSFVSNFEKAVGQYSVYRFLLKKARVERELFLAITEAVYNKFFILPAVREYVTEQEMSLLIFDPQHEEVIAWIK
ncbi:MAG: element excision factor XisH family protein [Acidobacteriota bacterium]|nr:element excision factor XisH family protein [Acidobacteriota bacterium]